MQRQLGQAEGMWRSCRAYLSEAIDAIWTSACERGTLTLDDRIDLRLAATHSIRTSCEIVNIAYNLGGSDAIFENSPLQRQFQDANVMSQQGQGRMMHFDVAGAHFLGLEPEGLF
jgi:alkylation response protein AidB-like acyl-CoA dehydrogenase